MEINQAFTILKNAGGMRAARIITENSENLSRFRVWRIARKLRRGVPVAKIIGMKWFYGLQFFTNRHTLDPRPDTETLVCAVISDCAVDTPRQILDLGTGTGCIIASIVKNVRNSRGAGVDISHGARRVARKNIRDLGLSGRIKIMRGNFANKHLFAPDSFDIIVSNPPYIARGDARVNDGAMHDPHIALYADDNGLGAYKQIAPNAWHWCKIGGKIYLEIGAGQMESVREIFESVGWKFVRAEKDLSGIDRVLVFIKN